MTKPIIFASNNAHKLAEIRAVLQGRFEVRSLKESGIDTDIPEPFDSLEANAAHKSFFIFQLTGDNCFSEDSGLFTEALNGAPGVYSARYAGNPGSDAANIEKLLTDLQASSNRNAFFKTVISLILEGREYQFEGICQGQILREIRGNQGFGYDPIFIPEGSDISFGEMNRDQKSKYSHRKKAMDKLIEFLQQQP